MGQQFLKIFIGLILISSYIGYCIMPESSGFPEEDKALYEFLGEAGRKIGGKYQMSPCGVGLGEDEGIWLMSLSFQRYGSLQHQSEARTLIVNCVIDLLDAINQDINLRPFLKNYPFTEKNISFAIYNSTKTGYPVYDPFIHSFSADQGRVSYDTKDPEIKYGFKNSYEEPFEEALAIVKKDKIEK